jgi:hypothetical protein
MKKPQTFRTDREVCGVEDNPLCNLPRFFDGADVQ